MIALCCDDLGKSYQKNPTALCLHEKKPNQKIPLGLVPECRMLVEV